MNVVRQAAVALRLLLVFTVILGVGYPAVVWAASRAVTDRAEGSLVRDSGGQVVGSALVGQAFDGEQWFRSRPSAADHDPLASGGSNLGPESPELLSEVTERRRQVARDEGVAAAAVPPDAVTASWSGVDPHISPEYARLQADRVARARGLPPAQVRELVAEHTEGRQLGFLGQARVNVLELNLALAERAAARS